MALTIIVFLYFFYQLGAMTLTDLKDDEGRVMLDTLGAFLIVINEMGQIIYVSEHVQQFIGYSPVNRYSYICILVQL